MNNNIVCGSKNSSQSIPAKISQINDNQWYISTFVECLIYMFLSLPTDNMRRKLKQNSTVIAWMLV